jgi:hypothetical protein
MRSVLSLVIVTITNVVGAGAQVLTPMALSDPKYQHLQQLHLQALMDIGSEVQQHKFRTPSISAACSMWISTKCRWETSVLFSPGLIRTSPCCKSPETIRPPTLPRGWILISA